MIDLCLALVIDWSGSIPPRLGREVIAAHVAGLRDDRVRRHADANGVAVTVILFDYRAEVVVPWQASPEAAAAALERIDPGAPDGGTATGEAIYAALREIESAPDCERTVIDVVSDGQSNSGRPVTDARDRAAEAGVVINAAVMVTPQGGEDPAGWAREQLITPGGFVLHASSPAEWLRVIFRKLVAEVAAR